MIPKTMKQIVNEMGFTFDEGYDNIAFNENVEVMGVHSIDSDLYTLTWGGISFTIGIDGLIKTAKVFGPTVKTIKILAKHQKMLAKAIYKVTGYKND